MEEGIGGGGRKRGGEISEWGRWEMRVKGDQRERNDVPLSLVFLYPRDE